MPRARCTPRTRSSNLALSPQPQALLTRRLSPLTGDNSGCPTALGEPGPAGSPSIFPSFPPFPQAAAGFLPPAPGAASVPRSPAAKWRPAGRSLGAGAAAPRRGALPQPGRAGQGRAAPPARRTAGLTRSLSPALRRPGWTKGLRTTGEQKECCLGSGSTRGAMLRPPAPGGCLRRSCRRGGRDVPGTVPAPAPAPVPALGSAPPGPAPPRGRSPQGPQDGAAAPAPAARVLRWQLEGAGLPPAPPQPRVLLPLPSPGC